MSDQFKVGTICIGQNFVLDTEYNDMECEIIEPLEMRCWHWPSAGILCKAPCYIARWANGKVLCIKPYLLRLPPPKQSDSQWADEAIRKLKKQSSDHVVIGKPELIPEEAL